MRQVRIESHNGMLRNAPSIDNTRQMLDCRELERSPEGTFDVHCIRKVATLAGSFQ